LWHLTNSTRRNNFYVAIKIFLLVPSMHATCLGHTDHLQALNTRYFKLKVCILFWVSNIVYLNREDSHKFYHFFLIYFEMYKWLVQFVIPHKFKTCMILIFSFKYHVFNAWRCSVWLKHIAFIVGTNKFCCGGRQHAC